MPASSLQTHRRACDPGDGEAGHDTEVRLKGRRTIRQWLEVKPGDQWTVEVAPHRQAVARGQRLGRKLHNRKIAWRARHPTTPGKAKSNRDFSAIMGLTQVRSSVMTSAHRPEAMQPFREIRSIALDDCPDNVQPSSRQCLAS